MTRPGKIPSQVGFEPGTLRSPGGCLSHLAIEAVDSSEGCGDGSEIMIMSMMMVMMI